MAPSSVREFRRHNDLRQLVRAALAIAACWAAPGVAVAQSGGYPGGPSETAWHAPQQPFSATATGESSARSVWGWPTGEPTIEDRPLEDDEWIVSDSSPFQPYDFGQGYFEPWSWKLLPDAILYRSYLAGAQESRFASAWNYTQGHGWLWDIALGGRAGILRYGTQRETDPEGIQLDIEGAALPRLDLEEEHDLVAVDFRFGIPLTWRQGAWQAKLAFYHLSAHLGDEFMVKNPDVERINFSRDVLVFGVGYFLRPDLRLYGEAGWAWYTDGGTRPWEFQFGIDWAPAYATGLRGAPFAAFNGHLRQENDFGGNLVLQAGWAWRGAGPGRLFRFGMEYYNGKSRQFEFFDQFEQQIGLGLWFDY